MIFSRALTPSSLLWPDRIRRRTDVNDTLEESAKRFLASLNPWEDYDLEKLRGDLTADEFRAIGTVLEDPGYKYFNRFATQDIPPLARLRLLIGLEFGTLSEQGRRAVIAEMGIRRWIWKDESEDDTVNVKQAPLVEKTGVAASQVSKFLHGASDGIIKTPTLDRIAGIVELNLKSCGENGPLDRAFKGLRNRGESPDRFQKSNREGEETQGGAVTEQMRHLLKDAMRRRGWTQKEVACWTGSAQSQICRFLNRMALKTDILDRLGAFLWIRIEASTKSH
jgi:hypothetical protein